MKPFFERVLTAVLVALFGLVVAAVTYRTVMTRITVAQTGNTVTLTVSRVEDIKIGRATITEIQATLTEAQANS